MKTLGLFVKQPIAGRVKTRLAAEIGLEPAARLYEAFVRDLVRRFRGSADRRVLCYWPDDSMAKAYFQRIAAGDYALWPQPAGSLGVRMASFFAQFAGEATDRVVLIGSDSPTLPRHFVELAFAHLHERDVVLGPSTDGGYYLVGQRGRPLPIFERIEWSTDQVLAQTIQRITDCAASLAVLSPWYDVDSPTDLCFLAAHVSAMRAAGLSVELENTAPLLSPGYNR